MIDFTTLKTTEEKLIALFLSVSKPLQQKNIVKELNINKSQAIKHLKSLIEKGILETFINEFGITLYRYAEHTTERKLPPELAQLTNYINPTKLN
ncbi:MAG: hypothetical protein LBT46_12060 [Planctomycetaceae bacterium]|jgi:predicted ArsR family transcriptional regulator|nr:hypothetical protein [Planctomycetaceae bacterium]